MSICSIRYTSIQIWIISCLALTFPGVLHKVPRLNLFQTGSKMPVGSIHLHFRLLQSPSRLTKADLKVVLKFQPGRNIWMRCEYMYYKVSLILMFTRLVIVKATRIRVFRNHLRVLLHVHSIQFHESMFNTDIMLIFNLPSTRNPPSTHPIFSPP